MASALRYKCQSSTPGQDWFDTEDGNITVTLQDVHVASGIITAERRFDIGASQLGPGARQFFELGPLHVETYLNELHRVQVIVDVDNEVDEVNESDNTWMSEYVLTFVPGRDECGPPPLKWNLVDCELRFKERYDGDDTALLAAIDDLENATDLPNNRFKI